jgi:hypothetical protein
VAVDSTQPATLAPAIAVCGGIKIAGRDANPADPNDVPAIIAGLNGFVDTVANHLATL